MRPWRSKKTKRRPRENHEKIQKRMKVKMKGKVMTQVRTRARVRAKAIVSQVRTMRARQSHRPKTLRWLMMMTKLSMKFVLTLSKPTFPQKQTQRLSQATSRSTCSVSRVLNKRVHRILSSLQRWDSPKDWSNLRSLMQLTHNPSIPRTVVRRNTWASLSAARSNVNSIVSESRNGLLCKPL